MVIYGIWAGLALLAMAATLVSIRAVREYEWTASYTRADATAEMMQQALLRSSDGMTAILNFAQVRVELGREGSVEAAAALDRQLQEVIQEQRFGIRGIASVRHDGIIDWSPAGDLNGQPVSDREAFAALAQATTRTTRISSPFRSRVTGDWLITISRSMHDSQGRNTGSVAVGFDPMQLSQLLSTIARKSEGELMVRRISNGAVRAAGHDSQAFFARGAEPNHPMVIAARQSDAGRLDYVSPETGRLMMAAFRTFRLRDMVTYAAFDVEAEMADYRRFAAALIATCLFYVVGSFLIAVAWHRSGRLRRRLFEQATVDPLTGLLNRRALEERMSDLVPGGGRNPERFGCLLFDIDHFKSINDRFGHDHGDQVLQAVARLLRSEVRSDDIVCRWGGEEILVVLRRCDRHQVMLRAEALRAAIEGLYDDETGTVHRVTASVGVACFPDNGETVKAVVGLADQAMYLAKRSGRNRVAMVEPALVI